MKAVLATLSASNATPLSKVRASSYTDTIQKAIGSMNQSKDWGLFTKHYNDFVKNDEPDVDVGIDNLDDPKATILMQGKIQRPRALPVGMIMLILIV
jgi:hypothetical protein